MTAGPTDVPLEVQVSGGQWSRLDVLMRNGGMAQVRFVTADDEPALRALKRAGLSAHKDAALLQRQRPAG